MCRFIAFLINFLFSAEEKIAETLYSSNFFSWKQAFIKKEDIISKSARNWEPLQLVVVLVPDFFIFSLLSALLLLVLQLRFHADWLPIFGAGQPSGLNY